MPDPDPWCTALVHGDARAYSHHHCRCNAARSSNAKQKNLWKLRAERAGGNLMVPIVGTQRRLRALAAEGWTFEVLAAALPGQGYHRNMVGRWARTGEKVYASAAADVATLYADLESTPGPSYRSRVRAREKGWPGPERWFGLDMDDPEVEPMTLRCVRHLQSSPVDEVVVARLISHVMPADAANRHERREATRQLWAAGLTTTEVARRLTEDERVVSRDVKWLQARGLADRRAT